MSGYARSDGYQVAAQQFLVNFVLLVAKRVLGLIEHYPHLHETNWLRGRVVLLLISNCVTRRHALVQARVDYFAIPGGILVRQPVLQYLVDDLHVAV